jgi:hypothetical protein
MSNKPAILWLCIYSPNFRDYYITFHLFSIAVFRPLPRWLIGRSSRILTDREPYSYSEHGISIDSESVCVTYGSQSEAYPRRKTWFFPWQQIQIAHWLLHPSGKYFRSYSPDSLKFHPGVNYQIHNFFGAKFTMSVTLQEETIGCRWRWLRPFIKPKTRRYAWIAYVADNNARARLCKGTIDLLPGETLIQAIERNLEPDEKIVAFDFSLEVNNVSERS